MKGYNPLPLGVLDSFSTTPFSTENANTLPLSLATTLGVHPFAGTGHGKLPGTAKRRLSPAVGKERRLH